MHFRSLTIVILLAAAAAALWLMSAHVEAVAGSPPASETVTPAEAKANTRATSREAGEDYRRREVAQAPVSRRTRRVVLTGRVVDTAGAGVRNAIVCVDRGRPGPGTLAETRANGGYEYTLEPGEHELLARYEGTALARATVQVPEGVDRFAAPLLVLPDGKVIRGRVLDAQENPVAEVRVQAFAEGAESAVVWSEGKLLLLRCDEALTDADGRFELRGLEDLTYTVRPEPDVQPYLRSDPRQIEGVVPDGRLLGFRLAPHGFVRGIVIDALTGHPVQRFFVMNDELRSADGRFRVPIGKYFRWLWVRAPGYLPQGENIDETRAGEDHVVRLAPDPDTATVVVVVKDDAGAPVRDFDVRTVSPGKGHRSRRDVARDSDGSLRMVGVGSGWTWLSVAGDGHETSEVQEQVTRDVEKRIEVLLVRSALLRLRVEFPDGRTARGVEVSIEDEQGRKPPWRFTATRAQGRNPPFREWFKPGELSQDAGVVPGGRFARGGAEPSRRLLEGDGLVGGLRPGRYRLIVSSGAGPVATPFTVAAGRTEELTVQLRD